MGGRSISNKRENAGKIGQQQIQASRDLQTYSQDQLLSNYNQNEYPEFKSFLKEIADAKPSINDKQQNLYTVLQRMPDEAKFGYWQATQGQNITQSQKLSDGSIQNSPKYPELIANTRTTSQNKINRMTAEALNVLGPDAVGTAEIAYDSYDSLLNRIEDAKAFLKGKAKPSNYWLTQNTEDLAIKKDIEFHANLGRMEESGTPGATNILLHYWLQYVAQPNEEKDFAKGQQEYSELAPDRLEEYQGYANPEPSLQQLADNPDIEYKKDWDPYARRFVSKDERENLQHGKEIVLDNSIKEFDDLLNHFKKGDKIRFVKLSDSDAEAKELKESVSIMQNLLFGESQSSILNQAIDAAARLVPKDFEQKKAEITKQLSDVSIVFSYAPLPNNAEMQYNEQEKTIIVSVTSAGKMLKALKNNDKATIKDIHEKAYHELTHAIHHAIYQTPRGRSIQDEFVADAFARTVLMARHRAKEHLDINENDPLRNRTNTFEQAKETNYDAPVQEYFQDRLLAQVVPQELLKIDPITRKPQPQQLSKDKAAELIQQTIQNFKNKIANIDENGKTVKKLNENLIQSANDLVDITTFKQDLAPDAAEKLDEYIKKSIAAHETRKQRGGGKSRFEPALEPKDRVWLAELFDNHNDIELQQNKEKILTEIHKILIGQSIPPSIISSLQVMSLRNAGVLVPVDQLSRAKRAFTKECDRLQKVMEQDAQDLEKLLKLLYDI